MTLKILIMDRLGPADELRPGGTPNVTGFSAALRRRWRAGTHCPYEEMVLTISYSGETPVERSVRVEAALGPEEPGGAGPWLIPGAFYGVNRLPHCTRIYPGFDTGQVAPEQLLSPAWSFRSDRAALPAVFGWDSGGCTALCTDELSPLGLTGLGFAGPLSHQDSRRIWLDFPYREEPAVFLAPGKAGPADITLARWTPGARVSLRFRLYRGPADAHAYDPFVRELYDLHQRTQPLNPWMGTEEAAALTAHGLYRWHYHPEHQILMETAAFDREFNGNVKGAGDRMNMHVGWVSGAPYAFALLTYGRRHERADYTAAAAAVLEKIAGGISPCGLFWGEWRLDRGWSQGWSPKRLWLHTRTLAEATLFMIRALAFERSRGHDPPTWEAAVRSNLAFVAGHQREDGNLGTYYHAETGEVLEWDGAGGILWIPALIEGAGLLGEPGWLPVAQRAGAYYRGFVEREFIYGAPEDVHLTPTSEDGYNAVMAYVSLFDADGDPAWLDLARLAADWTMTFRWTYNLNFDPHTVLAQYRFCSRGADQASPSNQHLHNYGLICLPEMLRLAELTGDRYYRDRTRDNLACFLQFIARQDGDFNAYKGMVTERFYNTNCFQPKGMLLTLSHAWCVGVTLYAAQAAPPDLLDG